MAATVFISSKSGDYSAARRVYEYLTAQGIGCFFSEETLSQLGEAEYKKAIEESLDAASYLVLVTSSRENAESRWVRHEWNSFDNEILAGRKSGNIITVLCGGMAESELPYALRSRQALKLESQLDRLPSYVGWKKERPIGIPPVPPVDPNVLLPFRMPDLQWLGLWVGSGLLLAVVARLLFTDLMAGRIVAPGILTVLAVILSGLTLARSWLVLSRCWVVSRWWFALLGIIFIKEWLFRSNDVLNGGIHFLLGDRVASPEEYRGAAHTMEVFGGLVDCLLIRLPESLLLRRQLGGVWWWFGGSTLTFFTVRPLMWASEGWFSTFSGGPFLLMCIWALFAETVIGLFVWWRAQVVSGKRR